MRTAPDQPVQFDEYEVLGYRVLVGAPAPHPLAEVRSLLRGFGPRPVSGSTLPTYEVAAVEGRWYVRVGEMTLPLDDDFPSAVHLLEWYVVNDALTTGDQVFQLHGGTLAPPSEDGAVALAGASGSGKSTLTLALIERGFRPYADDITLIAPATLEVRALRRAFHASEDSLGMVRALTGNELSVEPIIPGYVYPGAWAEQTARLRWLLFLDLRPGASPHATRLPPSEAAHAIMSHGLNVARAPRMAMTTCAQMAAQVACYRFVNGSLRESVELVERLVSEEGNS